LRFDLTPQERRLVFGAALMILCGYLLVEAGSQFLPVSTLDLDSLDREFVRLRQALPAVAADSLIALEPPPKVALNQASAEELDGLPGIGPAKAAAILELRSQSGGRFSALEDLLQVKGIGPATLERMRPRLTLDKSAIVGDSTVKVQRIQE
jgi:competence ComEA-like helix-hairpin-helix protein